VSWHPEVGDIQSLIDGELDPRARRALEAHMQHCERCVHMAARLRQVSDALRAVEPARAPAGLSDRILNAVAQAPSTRDLTCAECMELASAYLDRELGGSDLDAFEAHAFTCDHCYAAFTRMERTSQVLRGVPPRPAPHELFQHITAAVAAENKAAAVFTWRRVASAAAAVAAAAAIIAALLAPRGQGPEAPVGRHTVVAEQPAAAGAPALVEPEVAVAPDTAPGVEPVEAEPASGADSAATARTTRPRTGASHAARTGGTAIRHRATPRDVTPAETATPEARRAVDDTMHAAPVPRPEPAPLPASAPALHEPLAPRSPAPEPTAGEPEHTPMRVVPVPAPTPEPPSETMMATAPRTTGPEARSVSPAPALAPAPTVAPAVAPRAEEPVRLASVVPRQPASRTLYRASAEPPSGAIDRAREAVNRDSEPGWDDSRTGIELR